MAVLLESRLQNPGTTAIDLLGEVELQSGLSKDSPEFATYLDDHDCLASLRDEFNVPKEIYFAAHALGPPPRKAAKLLQEEVEAWATVGTKGHVEHPYDRPWVATDVRNIETMADIVGALPSEIIYSSGLTTNLHILLQSFYRPTSSRFKIIYEFDAFNSDRFALASQAQLAGLEVGKTLIAIHARPGETIIRKEDILAAINEHGDEACLVMLGAVNWCSGQLLDVPSITSYAQAKGCIVGWDIAHGVGNVEFHLHDWKVDFAVWCTYKYLCAGPGATGAFFVHEQHSQSSRARCAGWWGNDIASRFVTVPDFRAREGAAGWVVSNPSVFGTIPLHASLAIFEQVPALSRSMQKAVNGNGHSQLREGEHRTVTTSIMPPLKKKGQLLTAYLEYLLTVNGKIQKPTNSIELSVISPANINDRGSTLSVTVKNSPSSPEYGEQLDRTKYSSALTAVIAYLKKNSVPIDTRAPDLIRLSPAPLYNTFTEVRRLAEIVHGALQ